MRVLVWQWGRRGAGPLVATTLARELGAVPGVETLLSLSTSAEVLGLPDAPMNALPVRTYQDRMGFAARLVAGVWRVPALARAIRTAGVDAALCAMPAPLDSVMVAALRRAGVPYAVVVHDAQLHPGDAFPVQMPLQRWLVRRAGLLFALSGHVGAQLRAQGLAQDVPLLLASHPPFNFGPLPPRVADGRFRLLSFGRLMPYKGLDLLAAAMERLADRADLDLRVVGSGPESAELDRLRALKNVTVENRWVPEGEVPALLGWADAVVLTHREASQSGVAAAALSAGRWIVSTRVGGLEEQLRGQSMAVLCAPEPGSIAAAIASLPGRPLPEAPEGGAWRATAGLMAESLSELVREAKGGSRAGAQAAGHGAKRLA